MKTAQKFKQAYFQIFVYFLIVFLLLLTSLNINNYLSPKVVLGVTTEDESGTDWQEFVNKNPNYIPGWIELGQTDKVRGIDPNYLTP
jgi:hypothetical protein